MNENAKKSQRVDKALMEKTTKELIADMQEEDEQAKRERILQAMSPACREKLKYFDNWLRQEVSRTLRSRYELGLQVQELYEDERNNNARLYGRNALGRICKILQWEEGLLRMTLRFVRTYTPEELNRMCSSVLPGGEPLTWSHVRALLQVGDTTRRQKLLDRTVAEGWNCVELAQEIKNLHDGKVDETRGRPPKVPKDFDGAVAQQQEFAERWDRLHTKVWGASAKSVLAHAAHLQPEDITNERLHQARELAMMLRRVANEALLQAEKAEEVVKDFEHILDERQQADQPSQPATTSKRKSG